MNNLNFKILSEGGVRQTEFAALCGVSKIAVFKWTKGGGIDKRHIGKIEKLLNTIKGATENKYLPIPSDTANANRLQEVQKALVKQLRKA